MSAPRLWIGRDPADPVAGSGPVTWALDQLRSAWSAYGGSTHEIGPADATPTQGPVLLVGDAAGERGSASLPASSESFLLGSDPATGNVAFARGADVRGTVYAVLELADRVAHSPDPVDALRVEALEESRPANAIRSVARLFCSDVEDLGWFRDKGFWDRYLTMLVSQRFNRVSLTLGLGYNYHRDVSDAYLYFAYPFLVSVPGFDVRVPQLPDDERDRNLAALRSFSERAAARGLDVQLGLWTHAYEWIDSPNARHTIAGLTPETHATYCREALRTLLDACPSIGGVTLRVHGESGVPEGSWDFWRTVFEGAAGCGRRVGLDLHAKGLDEPTLSAALDTGLPVTVSTKFWAEHMGLPYHQAAIREHERLTREDPSDRSVWHRYMKVSEGSRPHTRYGYGDFLREDRPYGIVFRLWAGTQRVLLWGDPAFAAGYGRVAGLAGAQGIEWCEPLTFKGREGSGQPGSRTGYADPALVPRDDWEKYTYTYRLFGRLTYDPEATPESWRRPLEARFGAAALAAESALANASRILPLVTVAHHPSASNNYYWPEIYTDMPIVWTAAGTRPHPYLDTPTPRRFGTVDPLDPEVFSRVVDYVAERLWGPASGRVSPLEVASWLERLATDAARDLSALEHRIRQPDAETRRWSIDIEILAALGRFFAGKLRAAVAYELYAETGNREPLEHAVAAYRDARGAWADAARCATGVYVQDLTYGPQARIRGHWTDRLAAIDADLGDMEAQLVAADPSSAHDPVRDLSAIGVPSRPSVEVGHVPPDVYVPGSPLRLEIELRGRDADEIQSIDVRFRPMNQALAYIQTGMKLDARRATTTIGGSTLDGAYPLVYAFVLRDRRGAAWRHPDLGPDLSAQPYHVVRPEGRGRAVSAGGAP